MFRKINKIKKELALANEQIKKLKDEQLQSKELYIRDELRKLVMDRLNTSQMLMDIKKEIDQIGERRDQDDGLIPIKSAIGQIDLLAGDKSWDNWFEADFEKVYGNFLTRLKAEYPELTERDGRLCQFIMMSLTSKEISFLMNISVRGVEVSRYRLRKKLSLDADTNLTSFLNEY